MPGEGDDNDRRELRLQRMVSWLAGGAAALLFLGLVSRYLDSLAYADNPRRREPIVLVQLFDLGSEANVATWYGAVLLVGLAMVFLVTGVLSGAQGAGTGRWWVLSGVAAFLSVDEAAQVHEHLSGLGSAWVQDGDGLLTFTWLVPGALVAAAVGAGLLWLGCRLAPGLRARLVLGGSLFLAGGLGAEAISGAIASSQSLVSPAYVAVTAIEEGMEMAGVLVALSAVLARLRVTVGGDGLRADLIAGVPPTG